VDEEEAIAGDTVERAQAAVEADILAQALPLVPAAPAKKRAHLTRAALNTGGAPT